MKNNRAVACLATMAIIAVAAMLFACGNNNPQYLYVADASNNRILIYTGVSTNRNVAIVLGEPNATTTTGGTAVNLMAAPQMVALDKNGNLYVADTNNCRVLVFEPHFSNGMSASFVIGQADFTHAICPVNTSATDQSLNLPQGLAVDATSANLWVSDTQAHRVLRYSLPITANQPHANLQLGQAAGVAPGTSAGCNQGTPASLGQNTLCFPVGLAFDGNGNLWVGDATNNRVLKFALGAGFSNGQNASAVLGQADYTHGASGIGAQSLNAPNSLAFDSANPGTQNLWVADSQNQRVVRFTNAQLVTNGTANVALGQQDLTHSGVGTTQNTMGNSFGVAFDTNGKIYLTDINNNRTLVFVPPFSSNMNATTVLGQADFTHGSANQGVTAAANTQDNPRGVLAAF